MKLNYRQIAQLLVDARSNEAGSNHPFMEEAAEFCRNAGLAELGKKNQFMLMPDKARTAIGWLDDSDRPMIVPEAVSSIIPHAQDKSILKELARWTDIEKPIPSLPVSDGVSVGWTSEMGEASDGLTGVSGINQIYDRLTAYIDVSMQLINVQNPAVTKMLIDLLISAMAEKLDETILSNAARTATSPQGLGYWITTGTDSKENAKAVTEAHLASMEEDVSTNASLNGKPAFVTSDKAARALKTKAVTTGNDRRYLEDGKLFGYPLLHSNAVSDAAGADAGGSLLVFGNWQDLSILQLGGYFVLIDKYTLAKFGKVRIVITSYFSVKGLRGVASTGAGTDDYEYAKSFSSIAMTT